MWHSFQSVLGAILGPAITAAIVTFFLNTRDERIRASRDFHTKFIEGIRDDIRDAVIAGVAYFTCSDESEIDKLEAQVLLYESEIRSSMAEIRVVCDDNDAAVLPELAALEAPFLEALTGGTFGSAERLPSLSEARQLVGRGSLLRRDLAKLRRHQLDRARVRMPIAKAIFVLISIIFLIIIGAGFGGYVVFIWSN